MKHKREQKHHFLYHHPEKIIVNIFVYLYSQTLVLKHLPSQTIQFLIKLFMEKNVLIVEKTLILDLTTLSY